METIHTNEDLLKKIISGREEDSLKSKPTKKAWKKKLENPMDWIAKGIIKLWEAKPMAPEGQEFLNV